MAHERPQRLYRSSNDHDRAGIGNRQIHFKKLFWCVFVSSCPKNANRATSVEAITFAICVALQAAKSIDFTDDEHVVGDTWFTGPGPVFSLYKRNQGHYDPDRWTHNENIRSQRWLNDHSIWFHSNRFRSFLGRLSWRKDLWDLSVRNITMMSNYNWRVSGSWLLEPHRRFIERMEDYHITSLEKLIISAMVRP